jgi:nucleoside-diphosphate-sugar epimerase
VNVHGSLSVLSAAARYGVRRFVHVGSCFEYGSKAGQIAEDTVPTPTAIYGASKAAATVLLKERAHALGICLLVVRPFGIWGPGEAANRLIPQVVSACLNRSPLELTSCEVIRDLTYVEDMAANILQLALLEALPAGTVVNVGSGQGTVLRDFVLSVAELLGGVDLMQFGALRYRPTEMPSLVADITRLHQLLGDLPITPLVDGVRRMVARSG